MDACDIPDLLAIEQRLDLAFDLDEDDAHRRMLHGAQQGIADVLDDALLRGVSVLRAAEQIVDGADGSP